LSTIFFAKRGTHVFGILILLFRKGKQRNVPCSIYRLG
jgi:hypothetical protein